MIPYPEIYEKLSFGKMEKNGNEMKRILGPESSNILKYKYI